MSALGIDLSRVPFEYREHEAMRTPAIRRGSLAFTHSACKVCLADLQPATVFGPGTPTVLRGRQPDAHGPLGRPPGYPAGAVLKSAGRGAGDTLHGMAYKYANPHASRTRKPWSEP